MEVCGDIYWKYVICTWRTGASNLYLILICSMWDCTNLHNSFSMKKNLQVRDWLAKWLIDVEIYGSKVDEGFRRSSVGVVVVCCITTKVILASPHIKCSHIILCGLCLKHFVSSKVTFASMASLYGIAMKHSISSEYVWSNFRYTVFTVPVGQCHVCSGSLGEKFRQI